MDDVILGLFYGISLLFIATAGTVYWSSGSKFIALWFFVAGVVGIVLTAGLHAHRAMADAEHDKTTFTEAEKLARRAVLSVDDWRFNNIGPNLIPEIHHRIRNTGPTPATIIGSGNVLSYGTDLTGVPPVEIRTKHIVVTGNGEINSVLENPSAGPMPIPPNYFAGMAARKAFIFVKGEIVYRDIFNDEWELGFFVRYEAIPGRPANNPEFRIGFPSDARFSFLRKREKSKR